MIKVLVADKLAEEGVEILRNAGFSVDTPSSIDAQKLKSIIGKYQGIIIRSATKLTKDILEPTKELKVIGRAGVGLDNVDIETATKKGIVVMNAPGGNTISTAEHAFALMLAIAKKIPFAHISVKEKKWERAKFKGVELYSKKLGIIGLGRIGKEVAKRACSFGMKVYAYDPYLSPEVAERLGIELTSLENLIKCADFITLHTPLTPETKHLINKKTLSLMKKNTFLINASRGEIVDEEALYEALKNKKIAGAALDVFSQEPPLNSKLLQLDNVVFTPHIGATTKEAQVQVAIEIAQCVRDALSNKGIRNAVNYVQIEPETYKIIQPYIYLAETMGKFMAQSSEEAAKKIQVFYLGEISTYKVDILTSSFIKGFLGVCLEENINYVNALSVARERGIEIEQIKTQEEEEFVNSLRVKIIGESKEYLLEGTLFANKEARFVRLDNMYMEVAPSKYMLMVNNWDRPGVIGFLGTTLGKHKINIAGMSLGRSSPSDIAFTILNLDNRIEKNVLEEISSYPDIVSVKFIKLD